MHAIDENPDKAEPAHQHIDFRFAFYLADAQRVTLQSEEVTGHEWRTFDKVSAPTIREKLTLLPPTSQL